MFTFKKRLKKTRILSIDGGGIKGIVPIVVLSYLEKKLQTLSQQPQARIADYFDFLAGTSTGGIIVATLLLPNDQNRPKHTADDILNLYLDNAKAIFKLSLLQDIKSVSGLLNVKYDASGIEGVLEQYFGQSSLKSLLKPCLIPCYSLTSGKNYFFRQHKASKSDDDNYYLKDVLRAATSAITYFSPIEIQTINSHISHCCIDGGIFAINPAMGAYAEFKRLNPKLSSKDTMMFSLGTGKQSTCLKCEEISHWGAVEWRDASSNIIASSSSEVLHHQVKAVYGDNPYYLRLDKTIDKSKYLASFDNSEVGYLDFLVGLGKDIVKKNKASIDKFAQELIKNHDKK